MFSFFRQVLVEAGVVEENETTEVAVVTRNRGRRVLPNGQVVDTEQEVSLDLERQETTFSTASADGTRVVPVVINSNAPVEATMTDNSSGVSRNLPVLVESQGNPRRQMFRRTTVNRGSFTLAAMRRIRASFSRPRPAPACPQDQPVPVDQRSFHGVLRPCIKNALLSQIDMLAKHGDYVPSEIGLDVTQTRCCPTTLKTPEAPAKVAFAQYAGMRMLPYIMFPALPRFVDTIWILLELIVFIYYLVFNAIVVDDSALSIFMLVFSAVVVALVLIDAYVHFVENGTVFATINWCCRSCNSSYRHHNDPNEPNCCQSLPFKASLFLKTWIQPIRTFLSEIIVYIIIMTELVQTIESQTYNGTSAEDRMKFGNLILFLIYFGLSVFLARAIMALRVLTCVAFLPKTTSNNYLYFFLAWTGNLLLQMMVSGVVIGAVAAKLTQEACDFGNNTSNINFTGYVLYVMIAGGLVSSLGNILWVLGHYPYLRLIAMAVYIDVISVVKRESLIDEVFNDPHTVTKRDKAKAIIHGIDTCPVRGDYENYRKYVHLEHSISYWLTNPLFLIPAVFLLCLIVAILACLAFGYEDACVTDSIGSVLTDNIPVTVMFFLIIGFTCLADYIPIFLGIAAIPFFLVVVPLMLLTSPLFCIYHYSHEENQTQQSSRPT